MKKNTPSHDPALHAALLETGIFENQKEVELFLEIPGQLSRNEYVHPALVSWCDVAAARLKLLPALDPADVAEEKRQLQRLESLVNRASVPHVAAQLECKRLEEQATHAELRIIRQLDQPGGTLELAMSGYQALGAKEAARLISNSVLPRLAAELATANKNFAAAQAESAAAREKISLARDKRLQLIAEVGTWCAAAGE